MELDSGNDDQELAALDLLLAPMARRWTVPQIGLVIEASISMASIVAMALRR